MPRGHIQSYDPSEAINATEADYNVFQRNYFTKHGTGISINQDSDYNTIQYNIANDCNLQDGVAFALNAWCWDGNCSYAPARHNKIVSNEVFDWNDGFQIVADAAAHLRGDNLNYEGNVVYNNDIYWTAASYHDWPSGNPSATGDCMLRENALEWKAGSDNPNAPIVIAHNRVWGGRPSSNNGTANCSGEIYGAAQADHLDRADNLRFEGNIIFDGGGFTAGLNNGDIGQISANGLKIKNNLIYGGYYPTQYSTASLSGLGIFHGGDNIQVSGNVLVKWGSPGGNVYSLNFWTDELGYPGTGNSFANNVVINSPATYGGALSSGWTIFGNEYYNAAVPSWDDSPAVYMSSVTGTDWENDFCTTIKRLTNPTLQCFENARSTK